MAGQGVCGARCTTRAESWAGAGVTPPRGRTTWGRRPRRGPAGSRRAESLGGGGAFGRPRGAAATGPGPSLGGVPVAPQRPAGLGARARGWPRAFPGWWRPVRPAPGVAATPVEGRSLRVGRRGLPAPPRRVAEAAVSGLPRRARRRPTRGRRPCEAAP